ENGSSASSTTSIADTLIQVERPKEPMLQNTSCCSASCEDTNCIKATSALKVNTSAIPNSTTVLGPAARRREIISSSNTEPNAHRKAFSGIIQSAETKGMLTPRIIASAAPKEAAEDTPSVNGLANGVS